MNSRRMLNTSVNHTGYFDIYSKNSFSGNFRGYVQSFIIFPKKGKISGIFKFRIFRNGQFCRIFGKFTVRKRFIRIFQINGRVFGKAKVSGGCPATCSYLNKHFFGCCPSFSKRIPQSPYGAATTRLLASVFTLPI